MTRPPNLTALIAGLALVGLGVLLVLDASDSIDFRFAYLAPVIVSAIGAILLADGLTSRRRGSGSGGGSGGGSG